MKRVRIVERTTPAGRKSFVIQQKHLLFRWWWVDAWLNSWSGASCQDSFSSLSEARETLCWFDGSGSIDRIISHDEIDY